MSDLRLQPVQLTSLSRPQGPAGGQETPAAGFGDILKNSIQAVSNDAMEADQLVQGLVSGEHANIHETMIAMEKAGISLRLVTKVQQKVIDAYREISRMQL
jgi:flagellar hook-basal body complex protein FliE